MTCKEHKLDRGFISIFCYTDSHYVQKANEPIEQGERCAYKDIPLRQFSCHIIGHMEYSSQWEMRSYVPLSEQKSRKLLHPDGKKVIILTSYTLEEISQLPYSHYMDPVSYDCTNNFGKMPLLVALLTH